MRKIIIYRQFFTKADCYKNGIIQTPKGVQVHSTGANNPYLHRYVGPDDGLLGANKYNNTHNQSGLDVCANAYIGRLDDGTPAIYQTLPWDMRCWLSASGKNGNANKLGYIGFEICEDNRKNREYFDQVVMDLSVNLTAYLCQQYNIPVENVLDHSELYKLGIGSNHGDITWWLKNFGYNMNMYREAVSKAIQEGVQVEYKDGDIGGETIMYQVKVIAANGKPVNLRERTSTDSKILAKVPVNTIVDVVEDTNSKWKKVKYGETIGYMMAEFLQKIETIITPTDNKEELKQLKQKLLEAIEIVDRLLNT